MMKSKTGMTLMEILVVVIIMAILACMVLPKFSGHAERGAVAEAVEALSAIRQAEEFYSMDQATPGYTATLANLDIDLVQTNFTYGIALAGSNYTATATRQATGSNPCTGKTITITNAGAYGGTHPFGPNPVANATCV